jgi:hypothetical protein
VKIVFASAAMILMLAAPACAQSKATAPTPEQMMYGKTPDQVEKEAATEKAYKESLKKIPDAKAPSDPWGSSRGADAAKTATTKTAADKTAAKTPAAKKPPAKPGSPAN